uniref:C2H2-type domain-containing protein n=1 Tax=Octopus bimaculoides TaxID=37653 RepID=A0A0L8FWG8_OCTBM
MLSVWKKPQGFLPTLKSTSIDPAHWEDISANRPLWRHTIKIGSADFKKARVARAELKRRERKQRFLLPKPAPSIPCPQCPRMFHATLGLQSHLRFKHPGK